MLTVITALLGIAAALMVPVLAVVGVILVADWWQRRRLRVVARQIAVTDAIHRELGAVVAPVVHKRPWGPWTVCMTLPPEGWALAGSLAVIAHNVISDESIRVVFTPRRELARMA